LSAAFDLDFLISLFCGIVSLWDVHGIVFKESAIQKFNVKSGGQECPPHTKRVPLPESL
jgi:hypothetical protein